MGDSLSGQTRGLEGVVVVRGGEDILEEEGAAGLDSGEAILITDAVDYFVEFFLPLC